MRKVALRPVAGDALPAPVALAELRPGARYIAAVSCPQGTTNAQRERAHEHVRAALPESCSVVALPHGYALEIFEDGPPEPAPGHARRPRLGDG